MAKIITCMKAVPDRSSRLVIREDKRWVRDEDLTFGAGEADEYALEAALGIVEAQGGEVVVLTLGDARAGRLLRTALAKGAERAIHLSDPAFEGGDELATARVLARAVAGDGGADLVLTGVESGDLGSGVTGIMMAELLGWTHASVVIRIDGDISSGRVEVARELEGGRGEVLELDVPAVVTVQYGINEPRYPSLKGIMAAKKKEIRVLGAADLGFAPGEVGREGSALEVRDLVLPEQRNEVQMIGGTPAEAAGRLVELLRREARVL
jgi:electron transfer flavoprotein beta subunit